MTVRNSVMGEGGADASKKRAVIERIERRVMLETMGMDVWRDEGDVCAGA